MPNEIPVDPAALNDLDWHQDELDRNVIDEIREAIDGLPDVQREIVNGLFWERTSKSALSRRLGITRVEVDRQLLKAQEALGEAFQHLF